MADRKPPSDLSCIAVFEVVGMDGQYAPDGEAVSVVLTLAPRELGADERPVTAMAFPLGAYTLVSTDPAFKEVAIGTRVSLAVNMNVIENVGALRPPKRG